MNSERASEILQSKEFIDVQLNGQSIWIDSVDTSMGKVKIKLDEQSNELQTVSAEELIEAH